MKVIPFVHEGLGNSSYLVDLGEGKGLLVDPDRNIERYLRTAEAHSLRIIAMLETHLHADFVSGARELAHATGAQLLLPAGEEVRFPHQPVSQGERIRLAAVEIEIIASPGHTPEHLAYVLKHERAPQQLFSGGALIAGGAARTDLISPEMTEPLTRSLFWTLHQAFSQLPDETLLYPTHGGGSFCSTGATSERISTLGQERRTNQLLSFDKEDEFVGWFPTTFPAVPDYFFRMRAFNQSGPPLRKDIAGPPALSPAEFEGVRARPRTIVVDVRTTEDYSRAHIPDAFSNQLRDSYATWLGWLLPPDAPLLFVTDGIALEETIAESLLVGYQNFAGWLRGGMPAWEAAGLPVQSLRMAAAAQARQAVTDGATLLDVREADEFASGHIEGAVHIPLGRLQREMAALRKDRPVVAYCGHGERSTTALSLLEQADLGPLLNLEGGFEAWQQAGFKAVR